MIDDSERKLLGITGMAVGQRKMSELGELDPAARALARTGLVQKATQEFREEIERQFVREGIRQAIKMTPALQDALADNTAAQFEALAGGKKLPRHNFKDHEIRDFVNALKAAAGPAVRRDKLSRIVQRFLNER